MVMDGMFVFMGMLTQNHKNIIRFYGYVRKVLLLEIKVKLLRIKILNLSIPVS